MNDGVFWGANDARRIDRRIVVEGELVLQTPANFGTGGADALTDMPLLVDAADGISPLLTGTTLAGALRAALAAREAGDYPGEADVRAAGAAGTPHKSYTELLFGGFKGDDDGLQSALIIDDARASYIGVELRDSVKLDSASRTAKSGALFNRQLWPAGTRFPIRFELVLARPRPLSEHNNKKAKGLDWEQYQRDLCCALLGALVALTDGSITLGAHKRRGYGRVAVENWRIKQYDLRDRKQLVTWLQAGARSLAEQGVTITTDLKQHDLFKGCDVPDRRTWFDMRATFGLDGSILIRAGGQPGASPDMVHLSNAAGQPVLPGTSVAGALRARAARILNLLRPDKAADILDDMFGSDLHKVDEAKRQGEFEQARKLHASRLTVQETVIKNGQFDLIQNRVAIDRFTGGAFESALFNEQPLWGTEHTELTINLHLINPQEHEIGLLLLLLKDLWTGDLPLGGEISVGRGRLKGKCATLTRRQDGQEETWTITAKGDALDVSEADRKPLEQFVTALHSPATQGAAK